MRVESSESCALGVEPRAKGINFRSFVTACQHILGAATVEKMVQLLPPELAARVQSNSFIVGHWYPLTDFRTLHGAAQTASGRGLELARTIGKQSALDDFRGIYRVLTFVLSPQFLIKRTPAIWSRYYDVGQVSMQAANGQAHAHFRSAAGFDHVLWQDVIGGCEGVLEVCGAKDLKMTVLAGGGDEDHLLLRADWR